MAWWLNNNLRMIQNNIRDTDAGMDIDKHIQWLKSMDANVLQIGCGGITAFHPSQLDCQVPSPYMKGDFFGELLTKCHDNNIRVIARFDFSKTHEKLYEAHPDWYFRKADGSPVRYHDTVATCVNGEYQTELSLEILREVLSKYPVDGIFFNMFGYINFDYSGNYVGICQCDNCRRKFREMYGEELPVVEDLDDPVFLKYIEFKKRTVDEMLDKIHDLTKSFSSDIAVSTYAAHGIDIIRNESNSALDRPLPFWIYNSSDNVGVVEGSYDHKISSNCAINAVDLPYRFMGVSPYLNQIRLYGNIANGSGLDWCIIGNFEDYPDYENIESTREIFQFHKKYEEYYGSFDSETKIMLVKDSGRKEVSPEYRGIFRMLKEEHLLFTIVDSEALESKSDEFDDYDFIILPDIPQVSQPIYETLKRTGAAVIASGLSLEQEEEQLEELFSLKLKDKITDVRGTYIRTEPKELFPDFEKKDWVFLDMPYSIAELLMGARGVLPKVEKARFGPPERCFGHENTEDCMAVISENGNLYLPWSIGALYYQYGYSEFKKLLLNLMKSLKELPREFVTNAPEMAEMFFAKCGHSTYMLQIINMTGFNGMSFFEPLDLDKLHIKFTNIVPVQVEEMTKEGLKPIPYEEGFECSMNQGAVYKSFLIRA